MNGTTSVPAANSADGARAAGLACPVHHAPLSLYQSDLVCPECGVVGHLKGPVASFLAEADPFYEGKYANRTKYLPLGESYLATLPLRIVLAGYPNEVVAALKAGSRVVEIGCAAGIDWFGRRFQMIGMDLSLAGLEIAAGQYSQVVQCNATRMPLPDGSVDGVISSCLFEHLVDADKDALLAECMRVLRPGGKVVFFYDIKTDNSVIATYRERRLDLYQQLFLDGDGHVGYTGVDENRAHFAKAGLAITREVFHERTPVLSSSVWYKLSQWPGLQGRVARGMHRLGSGPLRLPWQGLIWVVDGSIGRFFPQRHARGMTTVAVKT
jgi:SAM-dependent methyltransferase